MNSCSNESKIVGGFHIHQSQLKKLLQQNHKEIISHLLIAEFSLSSRSIELIACIQLEYDQQNVEIGTYCIAVKWQNLGYAEQLLKAVEAYALA